MLLHTPADELIFRFAGLFSALYIQLLTQTWPLLTHPDKQFWQDNNVVATLLVRIVATLTGLVVAFLVNTVCASLFLRRIFEKRLDRIEWQIRSSIDLIDHSQNLASESLFNAVSGFLFVRTAARA